MFLEQGCDWIESEFMSEKRIVLTNETILLSYSNSGLWNDHFKHTMI